MRVCDHTTMDSSAYRSYPANNENDNSSRGVHPYSPDFLSQRQSSSRNPWRPYVQAGRDVNALALPPIDSPWDTRPPLYPPVPRITHQRQQPASSSYYGSSSPLRDFVPPQASLPQPHSYFGAASTRPITPPSPRSREREALEEELAEEAASARGAALDRETALAEEIDAALNNDDDFSDLEIGSGTASASSEDEDANLSTDLPEEPYGSTTRRRLEATSQPQSTMNPPPPRTSSPSSRLPSQHRVRRRSSTATVASLNNAAVGASSSKRRRTSTTTTGAHNRHAPAPSFSTAKSIEQIDLSNDSDPDDIALSSTLGKQRFDAIASQSASSAIKLASSPHTRGQTKLNTLQCTVCLDTPKDLTATSCGHTFCYACLMDWLIAAERDGGGGRRSNCPACRKPISRVKKGDVIPLEIKVMRRARTK